jgi:hypothetical protein
MTGIGSLAAVRSMLALNGEKWVDSGKSPCGDKMGKADIGKLDLSL